MRLRTLTTLALTAGALSPAAAQAASSPTVATGAPTSVARTSATLHGTVDPNGRSTRYVFQYGTSTRYGAQTPLSSAGSGTTPVAVSAAISKLTSGTVYHFRIVATSSSGASASADRTFKTTGSPPPPPPPPPGAATGPAFDLNRHGASVAGFVDPKGHATSYSFQFGLTPFYGFQTFATTLPAGTSGRLVTAALTGLASRMTYHFRLVATSRGGTTAGNDGVLRTGPFRAPFLSSHTSPRRATRAPVDFTTSGRLVLPAGVAPARACRGVVAVTFLSRGRTVAVRHPRLDGQCGYRIAVRFRRPARYGLLRVHARFGGNYDIFPRGAPGQSVRIAVR